MNAASDYPDQTALSQLPLEGVCPLPHLGILRCSGEDAATFLHNQLTQDVALLKPDQARLAGYCNAKGRLQASFVLFKRSPTEILLVCRRDLLASTLKRLSMFVLRAKAKLSDASEEFALWGMAGACASDLSPQAVPWARAQVGEADLITLYPAQSQVRALWVGPPGQAPQGPALSNELWLAGEVLSGVADVQQATYEAFVPQMLNHESVGGVNFKKGCYPGQEVVARSQFRGTLKRRTYLLMGPEAMQAGQEVFHSGDAGQPCGLIAQAASVGHAGQTRHLALAALQTNTVLEGSLQLAQPGGAPLHVLPLPYALLEDV
jgi:folate-binding protein YgfZ